MEYIIFFFFSFTITESRVLSWNWTSDTIIGGLFRLSISTVWVWLQVIVNVFPSETMSPVHLSNDFQKFADFRMDLSGKRTTKGQLIRWLVAGSIEHKGMIYTHIIQHVILSTPMWKAHDMMLRHIVLFINGIDILLEQWYYYCYNTHIL